MDYTHFDYRSSCWDHVMYELALCKLQQLMLGDVVGDVFWFDGDVGWVIVKSRLALLTQYVRSIYVNERQ